MSILDDLSSAIRDVHDSAGSAVVGIGQRVRGSGVVIADGRVLTNAHNLRGDEVTVTFRDGRTTRGTSSASIPTAISPSSRSTPPAPRRSPGPTPKRRSATSSSASRRPVPARPGSPLGTVSAIEQTFRGPGGSRIGGSLEHTAPLAPGSSGGPLVDSSGRFLGHQHEPDRRGVLPRPSGRCRPARAYRRPVAWRVDEPAASRDRDRAVGRRPAAPPVGRAERA